MTTLADLDPNAWIDKWAIANEYAMNVRTAARLLAEPDAPVVAVGNRRKARRGEFDQWLRNRPARGTGSRTLRAS